MFTGSDGFADDTQRPTPYAWRADELEQAVRGVVADEHVEPGFSRNCGVCGAGLQRVPVVGGLRAFLKGGLPTDAVHTDAQCFARWSEQQR